MPPDRYTGDDSIGERFPYHHDLSHPLMGEAQASVSIPEDVKLAAQAGQAVETRPPGFVKTVDAETRRGVLGLAARLLDRVVEWKQSIGSLKR